MKTRNSIRAEINALYNERIIGWLSDSVKSKKNFEAVRIYLGAPTRDEDVLNNKDEFVRFCNDWHKELNAGKVDFLDKTYPDLGKFEVPVHLVFEKVDDLAAWAGHLVEFHSAQKRLQTVKKTLPELLDSAVENIHALTTLEDQDFERFLLVCKWLCAHKDSSAMIRQIPVRGVDTLWFEKYRYVVLAFMRKSLDLNPLRRDLLQLGLVPPAPTVRLVLLDKLLRSRVGGLRDIGITVDDLAKLDIKPRKVLFFDDLATALSVPDVPGMVCLVLPFQTSRVCTIPWIAHAQCAYVSNIEMRAFAVLNNLRVHLPNTKSITLSKEFFEANSDLWSFDDIEIEELNTSMALNSKEATLYNMLAAGVFGRKARLPLERIPLSEIFDALDIEYKEESVEDTVVEQNSNLSTPAAVKNVAPVASVLTKSEETVVEKAANDDEIKNVVAEETKEATESPATTTENHQ